MKIDILSIFPNMFDGFLNESIIKRAGEKGIVDIKIHDFRNFSKDPHKKVDDYQFGGGKGMILMPEPIYDCVESIKTDESFIILMTPQGEKYSQKRANDLKKYKHLIIICGHYEGFDERIRALADLELSIGDYILTGGELPSMVITDSIVRLLDGAINRESLDSESFNEGLLDYPVYTKPVNFRGMEVPSVLLSGHHENINKWRHEESVKRTILRRPDILEERDCGKR